MTLGRSVSCDTSTVFSPFSRTYSCGGSTAQLFLPPFCSHDAGSGLTKNARNPSADTWLPVIARPYLGTAPSVPTAGTAPNGSSEPSGRTPASVSVPSVDS